MTESNGHSPGGGRANGEITRGHTDDPPAVITDLAESCVRFVEQVLGIKVDYQPETLPLVDHYIRMSQPELKARPEAVPLVAQAVGAYFGEVVRRRVASWWHLPSEDPASWELQAQPVYLSFNPVAVAYDAITLGAEGGPSSELAIDEADREALERRLGELPPADDQEFYSLSLRLEVIEIAVLAIKGRMQESGLGDVEFGPRDYED